MGVVSWGYGCAREDSLGVYAEVRTLDYPIIAKYRCHLYLQVSHFTAWLRTVAPHLATCPPPTAATWTVPPLLQGEETGKPANTEIQQSSSSLQSSFTDPSLHQPSAYDPSHTLSTYYSHSYSPSFSSLDDYYSYNSYSPVYSSFYDASTYYSSGGVHYGVSTYYSSGGFATDYFPSYSPSFSSSSYGYYSSGGFVFNDVSSYYSSGGFYYGGSSSFSPSYNYPSSYAAAGGITLVGGSHEGEGTVLLHNRPIW